MIQNSSSDALFANPRGTPPPADQIHPSLLTDGDSNPKFWTDVQIEVQVTSSSKSVTRHFKRPYVLIGSHPESDIVLNSSQVARRHLCLLALHRGLYCLDLAATLDRQQQTGFWIDSDSRFTVGRWQWQARLVTSTGIAVPHQQHSADYYDQPMTGTYPVAIALHEGREIGRYRVRKPITTIGQSPANKVTLSSDFLSTFHCILVREADELWIVDLLAANPTMINGSPIKTARVGYSGRVALGDVILKFRRPRPKASADDSKTTADDSSIHIDETVPTCAESSSDVLSDYVDSATSSILIAPVDRLSDSSNTPMSLAIDDRHREQEHQSPPLILESQSPTLSNQLEQVQLANKQQSQLIESLQDQLARLSEQKHELESLWATQQSKLEQFEQDVRQRTLELQQTERDRQPLIESLRAAESSLKASREDLQKSATMLSEKLEQLNAVRTQFDSERQRANVLETRLEVMSSQILELQQQIADRDQQIADSEQRRQQLQVELEKQHDERTRTLTHAEQNDAVIRALEQDVKGLRQQLGQAQAASRENHHSLEESQRQRLDLQTRFDQAEQLLADRQARCNELETRLAQTIAAENQVADTLRERHAQVKQLQHALDSRSEQAVLDSDKQSKLHEELAALTGELLHWKTIAESNALGNAAHRQEIEQLQQQLKSRQDELQRLQESWREQSQQLGDRDQTINLLHQHVASVEGELKTIQSQVDVLVPALELANAARDEWRESMEQANLLGQQQQERLQELQALCERQTERILWLEENSSTDTTRSNPIGPNSTNMDPADEEQERSQWRAELQRQEQELAEARQRLERARLAFERELGFERTQYQVLQNLGQIQHEKGWWYRLTHWFRN